MVGEKRRLDRERWFGSLVSGTPREVSCPLGFRLWKMSSGANGKTKASRASILQSAERSLYSRACFGVLSEKR